MNFVLLCSVFDRLWEKMVFGRKYSYNQHLFSTRVTSCYAEYCDIIMLKRVYSIMELTVSGGKDSNQIIILISIKLQQWWCFEEEI